MSLTSYRKPRLHDQKKIVNGISPLRIDVGFIHLCTNVQSKQDLEQGNNSVAIYIFVLEGDPSICSEAASPLCCGDITMTRGF